MINHLDNLLRHLFLTQIDDITTEAQVRFQPPDTDWRTYVSSLQQLALNVYLADLRENRKLRSNERVRHIENGLVTQEPAPARMDCHYLITAWSPAQPGPSVEPTLDEQALLYQATGVLMNNVPLHPARIYPPGSAALAAVPELIREADLPTQVLPVEGFPKLAEFWGTMGTNHRWKPAVYLVVTLPVALQTEIAGPMVTTCITEYRQTGRPETAEVWIQIGGHVQTTGTPQVVAVGNATVTALTNGGTIVAVNDATPFQRGDVVTEDNTARATIIQRSGNSLTLDAALAGLSVGDTLRIANILPAQTSFRLNDVADLQAGGLAQISGDDAANPGATITERVVIDRINSSTRFVTLRATPARTGIYNLNVPAATAPTLTPLNPATGAWVRLEDTAGASLQTTVSDADGRFILDQLRQGHYALRVRMQGFAEATRNIEVPSTTGNYDVTLT